MGLRISRISIAVLLIAVGFVVGRGSVPTRAPWQFHPTFQSEYAEYTKLWIDRKIEGVVHEKVLGRVVAINVVATARDAWYGFSDEQPIADSTKLFYRNEKLTVRLVNVEDKVVFFVVGDGIPSYFQPLPSDSTD